MAPSYQDCMANIFPGTPKGGCEGALLDQRTPVGSRAWNGDPGTDKDARPIYFEVKVNYDFWDYILEKSFQLDKNTSQAASSPRPTRCNAPPRSRRAKDLRPIYVAKVCSRKA